MSKMPFLPYLRMHTLNLESLSASESSDVRDKAETTHTMSRSHDGDEVKRSDCMDVYPISDATRLRFTRR
jgi:hypothetical protein